MMSEVVIRRAEIANLPAIKSLLHGAGLPSAGVESHVERLYILENDKQILGAVAFEAYPPFALLRSLVVAPQIQGQGHGRRLLRFILDEVRSTGLLEAYALTTTIPNWLLRLGFEQICRQDLPAALHASEELLGACPASALVFQVHL